MNASQIVEAVLFASDAPLKAEEIARADETLDEDRVEAALRTLRDAYAEGDRSFQIVQVAEGYQILTRPEFAPYLERFDTVPRPSRLSGPALETLAIVAYRQPIGRVEVEYIRGVGSVAVIRTLQDRGLVEVVGRGEGLGRPLLYGTTTRFLEHFGFESLDDLPRPEELPVVLRDNPPLDEGEDDEHGADPQEALDLASGAPESPASESPASESQASEPAASESPSSESQASEPPASESPSSESQASEPPASESPSSAGESGGRNPDPDRREGPAAPTAVGGEEETHG